MRQQHLITTILAASWIFFFMYNFMPANISTQPASPVAIASKLHSRSSSFNSTKPLPFGVNIWANIGKSYGVSESSRAIVYQLLAANVSLVINSYSVVDERVFSAGTKDLMMSLIRQKGKDSFVAPYYFNLFISFPHQASKQLHWYREHFSNHWNMAMYWWELEVPPEELHTSLRVFDEILTVTKYVSDSFQTLKQDRTPIHNLGCIALPELFHSRASSSLLPAARRRFRLRATDFVFLFVWDYHGLEARKNPLAIVQAFVEAFQTTSEKKQAVLILKAMHSQGRTASLLAAADSSYRIKVIAKELSDVDMEKLYAATNCYVSLHRSEGFGNGIAHAMGKGKPVIFTNYSAPVEFANETNAYPVKWKYVPVGHIPHSEAFPADAQWADADVSDAARRMREVF